MRWKREEWADWTRFRELALPIEVDFHRGPRDPSLPYDEAMYEVTSTALEALEKAFALGLKHVIFTHGHSTSGPGKASARSQVRQLMRSSEATPYVLRRDCIQHFSCFVAAIRENANAKLPKPACPFCRSTEVRPKVSWAGHFHCRCGHDFNWFDLTEDSRAKATRQE